LHHQTHTFPRYCSCTSRASRRMWLSNSRESRSICFLFTFQKKYFNYLSPAFVSPPFKTLISMEVSIYSS
jgi:hypothetical protein